MNEKSGLPACAGGSECGIAGCEFIFTHKLKIDYVAHGCQLRLSSFIGRPIGLIIINLYIHQMKSPFNELT